MTSEDRRRNQKEPYMSIPADPDRDTEPAEVVRVWAVRKVHDDSQPLDAAAMADWKELDCPCGGLVRLGSHAGKHAVAHTEPACSAFMNGTPVEFGQWMAAHWFGLIKAAGRHQ